jgi:hypothetical protein
VSTDFLPVPTFVIGRPDVSWGAKVLLGALYSYERRRKTWPTVAELVVDMKSPRRTVERWIAELIDAALVTSTRDGKVTKYAPAISAKNGGLRDLESPPEVAEQRPSTSARNGGAADAGPPPEVAEETDEHPPEVADVPRSAPLSGSLKREREGALALARPAIGNDSLTALGDRIREGAIKVFGDLGEPAPKETRIITWPGWTDIARWVRDKAQLLGEDDELSVAAHLFRCFARSRDAKRRGYPVPFLARNPLEYWRDAAPAELAS